MKLVREQSNLQLSDLRITRMEVRGWKNMWSNVDLDAEGSRDSLEVVHAFTNASWLNDLDLPFLDSLLNLKNEGCGSVSLREEGWAVLENDGNSVRLSDSFGDERCAIVAWSEFKTVMQLKMEFLFLMRYCRGNGVPRYSITEGFRARLRVPVDMQEVANLG